ncbi:MAG: L17 family ribosomal protein [Eubacteriales bacterium]|nr:L17 family ribosomal protein [Eubacteriales bacterium]
MPNNRKLGRRTSHRLAMLNGIVATLIMKGEVETTLYRAKEAQRIAEKLITLAAREHSHYEMGEVVVSSAKLDGQGRKVLARKTSKNGREYDVVEREVSTKEVRVDAPSRLAARRRIMRALPSIVDENGKRRSPADVLLNEIGPRFEGVQGGYTRIVKLGARRGDGAEIARLELVKI